jgi:hypothetical protein
MNFFKQEAADLQKRFREKELITSQKALERAWNRFGGKNGNNVDALNLQGLVRRARLAIMYQLSYTTEPFNPPFKKLIDIENSYLPFTTELNNPTNLNAPINTEKWLKLHWQICDIYMRSEGLDPEYSPYETFLPSTIPQEFVNFHHLSSVEAFRRRKAIKKHLSLLKLRQNVLPEHLR